MNKLKIPITMDQLNSLEDNDDGLSKINDLISDQKSKLFQLVLNLNDASDYEEIRSLIYQIEYVNGSIFPIMKGLSIKFGK